MSAKSVLRWLPRLTAPKLTGLPPGLALVLCTLLSAVLTLGIVGVVKAQPKAQPVETRCGWFANPTPANAWLTDRDGTWYIGIQGGYQAEGNWPNIPSSQWVKTNTGSYGYGCACMKVIANKSKRQITRIISATARPLSACRQDPALRESDVL